MFMYIVVDVFFLAVKLKFWAVVGPTFSFFGPSSYCSIVLPLAFGHDFSPPQIEFV